MSSLEKHISEIQEDFNKVLHHSEHLLVPHTQMDTKLLFAKWAENKNKFYNTFGNKLIYEIPGVSFPLSQKDKEHNIDKLINEIECFYMQDKITYVELKELAQFIRTNEETFFQNTIDKEYKSKHLPQEVIIPKGTKLVKDIKYIISEQDICNAIQQLASKYIQQDKIKGTLCYSIHPLDYISISENNHGWRSCHALDGEFCAGNLEYMADPSTIVCYLRTSDDKVKLPNFPNDIPWYSKAWRALLFAKTNFQAVFINKQYPYENINIENEVISRIGQLISYRSYGLRWNNSYKYLSTKANTTEEDLWNTEDIIYLEKPIIYHNGVYYHIDKLFKHEKERPHYYFDIVQSTDKKFIPKYWINYRTTDVASLKKEPIKIGGDVRCVCCGSWHFADSDTMLCKDCLVKYSNKNCESVDYCDECGARIYREDVYFDDDTEEHLCEYCYNKRFFKCEECGDILNKKYYWNDEHPNICIRCANREKKSFSFKNLSVDAIYAVTENEELSKSINSFVEDIAVPF